jgi:hypothetical protein
MPAKRKRGGRNGNGPVYSKAVVDEICNRLMQGESLRSICRDAHMPHEKAVRNWVIDRADTFGRQYTRARELGYQSIAEEIIEISDENPIGPDGYIDNGAIQRARLRTDSRRWFLSKMLPSQFGDKVTQEIVGDADQPIVTRIELVPVDPHPTKTIDHEPDRE